MRVKADRFQDMEVWKNAHALVLDIYKVTKNFPAEEKFGLVSQMRRAGVSIAASIAEGFKKRGSRDKINFYHISQGSVEEIKYYLILSKDLAYLETNDQLVERADVVGRMLHGLINSIQARNTQ